MTSFIIYLCSVVPVLLFPVDVARIEPHHPLTAATAFPTPSCTVLTPIWTKFALCLTAVRPNESRSNTAGVGENLVRDCVMGDIGLSDNGCEFLKELMAGFIALLDGLDDEVDSEGVGADRFLMTTGSIVKPVKRTNLAMRTGSLSRDVRLSPPCSSDEGL